MRKQAPHEISQALEGQRLLEAATAEYKIELRRFLKRRTRNSQAVADLAQEVLLRLLRFPAREVVEQPRAYLFRVASNVARDFALRASHERVDFDSARVTENLDRKELTVDSDLEDRISDEREVEQALAPLPAAWRAVLLLRYRDGYSFAEIARELNTTVDSVQKRAARGLERLRLNHAKGGNL
jgi:RNA polymerase sigma factor (sigma-70 family)